MAAGPARWRRAGDRLSGAGFIDRAQYEEALPLLDEQERLCRELGLASRLQRALGYKAIICRARSDLGATLDLLAEQEMRCRGHAVARQRPRGNLAASTCGLTAGLMGLRGVRVLKEVPRYCREVGLLAGLEACLGNTALTYRRLGGRVTAAALLAEEEALCRELGLLAGLQSALGNKGVVLCAVGDAVGALAAHEEEERLCRTLI